MIAEAATTMRGYTKNKDAYLRRLRRVEGQVRGLQAVPKPTTRYLRLRVSGPAAAVVTAVSWRG